MHQVVICEKEARCLKITRFHPETLKAKLCKFCTHCVSVYVIVVSPGELEGRSYREPEVHRVNVVDVDQTNHRIHLKRPSIRPTVKNKAEPDS